MNNYLYHYIDKLIHSSNNDRNTIYIKSYNRIDAESFIKDNNLEQDFICLSHTFEHDVMHSAFEPFFEWIRLLFNNYAREDFDTIATKCNVYFLHRKLFSSYIETGICERTEDILIPEIRYDYTRLLDDIINMVMYFCNEKRIICVLNSLHLADNSTYELLSEFAKYKDNKNIYFIYIYNDASKIGNYTREKWIALLECAHDNVFQINEYSQGSIIGESDAIIANFRPISSHMNEYMIMISNMVLTLCCEQALDYLNQIQTKVDIEQIAISKEDKIRLSILHAYAYLNAVNYNSALLMCDKVKALLDDESNPQYSFSVNYLSALAYVYSNNHALAVAAYERCAEGMEKLKDEYHIFKCELLFYLLTIPIGQGVDFNKKPERIPNSFINKLKTRGFYNHLAYIVAYGYKEDTTKEEMESTMYPCIEEGIKYAKEIGNENFTIMAYNINVYTSFCLGKFDGLAENQKRCIELLKEMNNPGELLNTYNSIGYNCSVHEDFSEANAYYNEALKLIISKGMNESMHETLYNKAVLAIQYMDYETAAGYLKLAIQFIDEFHIERLNICNKSKLYGLLALCYYYIDKDYNCYLYLLKLERYVAHIIDATDSKLFSLWDDDMFLYHLLKALLITKEGDYKLASEHYDKALYHMNRSTENKYFALPVYSIERSKLYEIMGENQKGQALLKECVDFCYEKHYFFKYMIISSIYSNMPLHKPVYDLSLGDIDKKQLQQIAKQCGIARALENRNKDMRFLSIWKELIGSATHPSQLIMNSIPMIMSNFGLDSVIFYSTDERDNTALLYGNENIILTREQIHKINATLVNHASGFVTSRIDDEYANFHEIIDIFGRFNIASIMFCPVFKQEKLTHVFIGYVKKNGNFINNTYILYNTDLEIVSFAIRQLLDSYNILCSQMYLKEINLKLEHAAVTDRLTQLYNRQGMYNIFNNFCPVANNYTILYVDLDNFKYYNDTFGHNVGDQILIKFAGILRKCADKESSIVRYGGDEFLIITFNSGVDYASEIAKKIITELNTSNYFSDLVNDYCIQKGKTIPDTLKLTCSIGISEGTKVDELDAVLANADKELFNIKKTTKNAFSIHE